MIDSIANYILDQRIKEFEDKNQIHFKPRRDFYEKIKIGQKRFQQLRQNKVEINFCEMCRLQNYFQLHNPLEMVEYEKL